jgi:peptidoglycan hydrolase CwlO-like protein
MVIALLVGVLGGWALAKLAVRLGGRPIKISKSRDQELNYRIRALETDLRLSQRKADEVSAKLEQDRQEIAGRKEELESGLAKIKQRDEQIVQLKKTLADECTKTNDLRLELTDRAEQTIRATVRMKEIETELSVAQAGSTAVADEIHRLSEEREQLTDRIKNLQQELATRNSGSNVSPFPTRDRIKDH